LSMTLTIAALEEDEIARVLADPGAALDLVFPEDETALNEGAAVDLDKSWHGIHYLLTGTAWEGEPPLNALVAGGRELPDPEDEWGYGPPRFLNPSDTAAFGAALELLSDEELAARFEPSDMLAKGIYPEIWDRDPADDDTLAYLMEYVTTLREFMRHVLRKPHGLLIAIV
jgi:Domain of unknown function (DUF1877)